MNIPQRLPRRRRETPPTLFDRLACACGGALIGAFAGLLFGLPCGFVLNRFGFAAANDVAFVFLPCASALFGTLTGFIAVERGGDVLGDLFAKACHAAASLFHS